MSWEPGWVADGRGGFRRSQRAASEDEGEVSDGEEEGQIPQSPNPPFKSPSRSSSTGMLDFRQQGHNGPLPQQQIPRGGRGRLGGGRGLARHAHRNSFSGVPTPHQFSSDHSHHRRGESFHSADNNFTGQGPGQAPLGGSNAGGPPNSSSDPSNVSGNSGGLFWDSRPGSGPGPGSGGDGANYQPPMRGGDFPRDGHRINDARGAPDFRKEPPPPREFQRKDSFSNRFGAREPGPFPDRDSSFSGGRDSSFGGGPPNRGEPPFGRDRDSKSFSSHTGPRERDPFKRDMAPRDMGGPRDMGPPGGPRDMGPIGPRDMGPRDMGPPGGPRDTPGGLRDMGPPGGPRDIGGPGGRDMGPPGGPRDMGGPRDVGPGGSRDTGAPGGRVPFNQRGGTPGRDGGPHHYRDSGRDGPFPGPGREPSFEAAAPPIDQESLNEILSKKVQQIRAGVTPGAPVSGGAIAPGLPPNVTVATASLPPPSNARPTDPRRRPSKEPVSSIPPPVQHPPLQHANPDGAAVALPSGPPPPARRMGSYSSLADSSGGPSQIVPTVPPPSGPVALGGGPGPNRPGGLRSPIIRRTTSESFRDRDRNEGFYGPVSGPSPRQQSWSPNDREPWSPNDRGRPGFNMKPASPNRHSNNMPPAPSLQSQPPGATRPPNFRNNDPRFKQQVQQQDIHDSGPRPDHQQSSGNVPGASRFKKSRFGEGRFGEDGSSGPPGSQPPGGPQDKSSAISSGAIPNRAKPEGAPHPPESTDPFGRTRDWKDRPRGGKPGNTTPKSSPVKQKQIQPFSSSPQSETRPTEEALAAPSTSAQAVAPSVGPSKSSAANYSDETKVSALSVPKKLPPLLTSSLGDQEVVKRAEAAVKHLCEVVPNPNLNGDESSQLPTKQVIMKAVAELDKKIKEAQKVSDQVAEERKDMLKEEEAEREREVKRSEENEKRKKEELDHQEEAQKEQEKELRVTGLQKAIEDQQGLFDEARKKAEEELAELIQQAKDDEKKRCLDDMESQIESAAETFDKDIAKARRDLEKAKNSALDVEAKVASVEEEYKSMLEGEETRADDKQRGLSQGGAPNMANLIASINADNKRRAVESQMLSMAMLPGDTDAHDHQSPDDTPSQLEPTTDPKHKKTAEEWSAMAKQVAGLADALYSDPSDAPYYEHNERTHSIIGPSVKEYIRDKRMRLVNYWTELAEEYEVRKLLYDKQQSKLAKKGKQRGVSVSSRKSILEKTSERSSADAGGVILESGRSSNNPYRRARRGNEVRSEYEQEQIIAEITAKEAMEKRIKHGGCKLPRQICRLERELTATYINNFTAQRVDDPSLEEQKRLSTNVWSDMEKCIFLDRFLQFPKDFRRISSFLRNKTTRDCVEFYYDSKQTVPYKGALKEHMMRRKRRGDYAVWDASIQAAVSVGATIQPGSSEEKPVVFSLPESDRSFATKQLHPLTRTVLDVMEIDESLACVDDGERRSEGAKWKSRKRGRDPLFILTPEQTKFLKASSQELMTGARVKASVAVEEPPEDITAADTATASEPEPSVSTPVRKAPQKWTSAEKNIFLKTLEEHGRDWAMLSAAVGTKTISQIKNFYYDYKKQVGKHRSVSDKKSMKSDSKLRASESEPTLDASLEDEEYETPGQYVNPAETPSGQTSQGVSNEDEANHVSEQELREESQWVQQEAAETRLSGNNPETGDFVNAARGPLSVSSLSAGELGGNLSAEGQFVDANRELIQQLLNQQRHPHQLGQHQQQQQSAIQKLLSQHQQQQQMPRDQVSAEDAFRLLQQRQHQADQLSVEEVRRLLQQQQQLHQADQLTAEEARRLLHHQHADQLSAEEARSVLQHHSQSQHQQLVSNLFPWLSTSQVLQAQRGLPQALTAAALQHREGNPEWGDVSNLQSLLQLQHASQYPFGGNSQLASLLLSGGLTAASSSSYSPSALAQAEELRRSQSTGSGDAATAENLAALAGVQGLLGFSGSNQAGGNPLLRQATAVQHGGANSRDSSVAGVADALSFLATADSGHSTSQDGGDRYM